MQINITLTPGAAIGPFSIYYDAVIPANLVLNNVLKSTILSGISLNVPDNIFKIIITNNAAGCNNNAVEKIISTPAVTPSIVPAGQYTIVGNIIEMEVDVNPANTPVVSVTPSITPTNSVTPSITPSPAPVSLTFNIINYNCTTGVLQYRFLSSNSSAISVNMGGVFAGNVNPYEVRTHTYPSDALIGRNTTGTATQAGVTISINFTTSCSLTGSPSVSVTPTNSVTPSITPSAAPVSLTFNIISYSCTTGVLQYRLLSSNNSAISVNMGGVFAGNMNPYEVRTHTYPSDALIGRNTTGTATQAGVTISINFTTSCSLTGSPSVSVTPSPTANSLTTPTPSPSSVNSSLSLQQFVGSAPTYLGQIDTTTSYQLDTNVINLQIAQVRSDGYIRLTNTATDQNPNNGRSKIYQLENMYVDDIENRWFSPNYPIQVRIFWVDHNVPRYAWQSNQFKQYEDFYKGRSFVTFK